MKRKIIIFSFAIMLMATPFTTVYASPKANPPKQSASVLRADVIETKYRVHNGVLQYRRWNKTHGYWVDDAWIDLK